MGWRGPTAIWCQVDTFRATLVVTLCVDLTRIVGSCYVSCMAVTRSPNFELQRERFRQQMTRAALANRTHISRKSLLDIEQRRVRPRLDTAARIAKALKVDVTDLFDESEIIG